MTCPDAPFPPAALPSAALPSAALPPAPLPAPARPTWPDPLGWARQGQAARSVLNGAPDNQFSCTVAPESGAQPVPSGERAPDAAALQREALARGLGGQGAAASGDEQLAQIDLTLLSVDPEWLHTRRAELLMQHEEDFTARMLPLARALAPAWRRDFGAPVRVSAKLKAMIDQLVDLDPLVPMQAHVATRPGARHPLATLRRSVAALVLNWTLRLEDELDGLDPEERAQRRAFWEARHLVGGVLQVPDGELGLGWGCALCGCRRLSGVSVGVEVGRAGEPDHSSDTDDGRHGPFSSDNGSFEHSEEPRHQLVQCSSCHTTLLALGMRQHLDPMPDEDAA